MVQSYSVMPKTCPPWQSGCGSGYFTAGFCNNPLVGVINNGLRRGFLSFLNYSGLLTSRPTRRVPSRLDRSLSPVVQAANFRGDDPHSRCLCPLRLAAGPILHTADGAPVANGPQLQGQHRKVPGRYGRLLCDRPGIASRPARFCLCEPDGHPHALPSPPPLYRKFAPHVLRDREAATFSSASTVMCMAG
jgi:hypothetical protein